MATARLLLERRKWTVSAVARALGVSRPHLSATRAPSEPRGDHEPSPRDDDALLDRIRPIIDQRGSCGYRRVTALLNRQGQPTPAYSPESNGMGEAFVKTFKRDYVYLADFRDAATVLASLKTWFDDYNEHHPHRGLGMRSPREYRERMRALLSTAA